MLKFNYKESLLIFVRGLLMGSADIIPGISGGTIAIVTGIYERLLHSISKINFTFLKPLIKGNFSRFKTKLFEEVDFQLFIPLLLGISIAMLTLSKVVSYALEFHPAVTYSFLLGLILASAYVFFNKLSGVNLKNILLAFVGFICAIIFVSLNPIEGNHTLPVIFFSGFVAICALILPGISGSFILLLLGQYEFMLNALHQFKFPEIITFIAGAIIGLLGFSRVVNYLLEHHEEVTMAFFIGVMIGTLKIPFNHVTSSIVLTIPDIVSCLICAFVGILIIVILEKKL